MKFFFSVAALFSLVLAEPGFVKLPVTSKVVNSTNSNTVSESLQNQIHQYSLDLEIGTPGQLNTVTIDTGSSDLWVYGPKAGEQTYFDPSQSSTAKFVDDAFEISYVDGRAVKGDDYTDDVLWGGTKVNVQFAVTNHESGGAGILGIGFTSNESDNDGSYVNYPEALKQQGFIESNAYSLYLDDVKANSGTLLFGGVDTGRYTGQLYTVPITSKLSFDVDFEVLGHKLNGVLDSGTSFTFLPDDIVSGFAQSLNAYFQKGSNGNYGVGYYTKEVPENASLTYSFSGAEVTVPSSELFLDNGDGTYYLTVLPWSYSSETVSLGDSFLRSAYVVYDLDNNQIGIAQASYNESGPISAITSSGIPGSQPAPGF